MSVSNRPHAESPYVLDTLPEPGTPPDGVATEPREPKVPRWVAGLRLVTGLVFLWSFFDKLLGLGYPTPSGRGWLDGTAPAAGFLQRVAVGPMQDTFHSWSGQAWADWLYMAGLAGVGVAVSLGVALRLAALSGTLLMGFLYLATWPVERTDATGSPTHSTNPVLDQHVIYALVLVVLAVTCSGDRWGLGRAWRRVPFVARFPAALR